MQRLEVVIAEDDREICLTEDVENRFETVLQRPCRSLEASKRWLKDLRSNQDGASVALLPILLPNLTDLGMYLLSSPDYVTVVMQWSTLQHGRGSGISLQRQIQNANFHRHGLALSRLSVLRLEMESFVDVELPPILRLPSLRTLSADSFPPSNRAWSIEAGVSGVHSLELTRCGMDEDDILPLLQACRELRRFTFYWDQPWSDDDVMDDEWDEGINVAPWIIEGLQRSRDTLEVLDLRGQSPIRQDTRSLGRLTAFSRLHSLCVPAVMVLNPNDLSPPRRTLHLLPKSPKNLRLIIAGGPGEEMLESELLKCLRLEPYLPALAVLTITWHRQHPFRPPNFRCLERACRDRGVAFAFEMIP